MPNRVLFINFLTNWQKKKNESHFIFQLQLLVCGGRVNCTRFVDDTPDCHILKMARQKKNRNKNSFICFFFESSPEQEHWTQP